MNSGNPESANPNSANPNSANPNSANPSTVNQDASRNPNVEYRTRCYGCFRPESECYCDAIPSIDNRTAILIVQHVRERGHAFNTARMVQSALHRSVILCGNNQSLAKMKFPLSPRAGLLYPSSDAKTLAELPACERPEQLVIIDGTWSQANSMVRDLPQLKGLPHYKLAPTQPGQYRIRLEPTDTSLSTVEAAVEALRELEPETAGLDQLLGAFGQMVQRQLDHPQVGREHYSHGPKSGWTINIPKRILGRAESIVVAYGESGYRDVSVNNGRAGNQNALKKVSSVSGSPRQPLVWVAERLSADSTNASPTFARFLKPDVQLTDSFLRHLELTPDSFVDAVSPNQFREQWRGFLREGDTVVAYNHGTIRLLQNVEAEFEKCVDLKSVNFDSKSKRRRLSEFVEQENLQCRPVDPSHGRAGKRLANAIALVNYLRDQH